MVDIDPTATGSKYAPREPSLVDAVAEAARIADQQMRSNPLKNAQIDSGLTLWKGNYGGSLVWIGEIQPADKNQFDQYGNNKPQRAFVLQRDDPVQSFAITMYDFNPQAGVPLKQRLQMFDINGKPTYRDGWNGGRAFPDQPIVMYQRESFENPAATWISDRSIYSGEGNLVGTKLEFSAAYTTSDGAATSISNYLRVSGGGVTITTATSTLAGNQNVSYSIDISTIYAAADFLNVEWHMWRASGTGSFVPRIYRCRNYSDLFQP